MRLPVYNNSTTVTAEPIARPGDYSGMAAAAKQGFDAYNQWQKVQDAADAIDGKNAMRDMMTGILDEAKNYTGYESEKDILDKQKELRGRMEKVLPEVTSKFGNSLFAKKFAEDHKLAEQEMLVQLDGIFREKTLDNFMAAADKSYTSNMNSYIASGNEAYKQSFIDDMRNGFKSGLISKEELQKQINRTEAWNELYLANIAEKDPNAFIKNIDEYNKRFKNVDAVKTALRAAERAQRFQELEKAQNQSNNYLTLARDLPAMNTADAILNIDNAEASEAISPKMAKTLRARFVGGKVDADGKRKTDPQTYLELSRDIIDLQAVMGKDPGALSQNGKEMLVRSANSIIDKINAKAAQLSDSDYRNLLLDVYKAESKTEEALKVDDDGKLWYAREYTYENAYDDMVDLLKGDPNLQGVVAERAAVWREYTEQVAKAKPGVLDGKQLKSLMRQIVAKHTAQAFRRFTSEKEKPFEERLNEELEKRKAK